MGMGKLPISADAGANNCSECAVPIGNFTWALNSSATRPFPESVSDGRWAHLKGREAGSMHSSAQLHFPNAQNGAETHMFRDVTQKVNETHTCSLVLRRCAVKHMRFHKLVGGVV